VERTNTQKIRKKANKRRIEAIIIKDQPEKNFSG